MLEKLFVKAIFYRLFASIFIFIAAYVFTKRADIALSIGITEFIIKIILYFVYDILWMKLEKWKAKK